MKKFVEIVFICVFTCFSFYYTDKVLEISREKDPLMIEINKHIEDKEVSFVNGVLSKESMLVGSSGVRVDAESSYEKMRKLDEFNEALLEYVSVKPSISKRDNLDKLIIGKNTTLKEISFVFVIDDFSLFEQITYILNQYDVSSTFFMDGVLFENNIDGVLSFLNNNTLGFYGYNKNYGEVGMRYVKGLFAKNINYSNYCLYVDDVFLKTCMKYKVNTIRPYVIENNIYDFMKNDKRNGYIYQIDVNSANIKELTSAIIYLKQRGYSILNIDELLKE